jgi:sigma-B regulation protein RsbU (phosphoserine phosphatase)
LTPTVDPSRPGGLLIGHPEAGHQADERGADERAALWAEPLQRLALALVRAVSLDDVAAAVAAYGTIAAGAGCAHVLLLDHRGGVGVSLLAGPGVPSRRLDNLGPDVATPWDSAMRERRPVAFRSADDLFLAYPALEPVFALPSAGPVITTPLLTVGEVRGAVTFGFAGPVPVGEVRLDAPLDVIAALAGQAAARTALFASERQSAELLQRAYLPNRLSPLGGLSFGTRYLPAGEPMVGGDWYDVIPLPGHEAVGIIMGDVAGHGLPAATVMASLRGALRAFATVETCPARMIARLNDYSCLFKPDDFATVFVAVFESTLGKVRYARAGHPPALLIDTSGDAQVLEGGLGPPLGFRGGHYERAEQDFPAGATLVAYTDGLIERRDEPIDGRLADLVTAASAGSGAGPDGLCDRLVFEMLAGKDLTDDAALLVATRDDEGG